MIGLSLHSTIFYSYFDTFYCYCVWCVRTSVWFDVMILIFCSNVFFFEFCPCVSFSQSLIFSLVLSFSSFPIESSFINIVLWIFIVWLCVLVLCMNDIRLFIFVTALNELVLSLPTHSCSETESMNEWNIWKILIELFFIRAFEYLYIDDVCFNHLWNHQEWISKNRIIFGFFNP